MGGERQSTGPTREPRAVQQAVVSWVQSCLPHWKTREPKQRNSHQSRAGWLPQLGEVNSQVRTFNSVMFLINILAH